MVKDKILTILKISGLFLLLEGVLFVFLFFTFFLHYEIYMRVLASGFVALFLSTIIWVIILTLLQQWQKEYIREREDFSSQPEIAEELIEV